MNHFRTMAWGRDMDIKETKLTRFIDENPVGEFTAEPRYFADGDYVIHFLSDQFYTAYRVDELLTVYIADDDPNTIVGFKIKGVARLLRKASIFVGIDAQNVKMGYLFLSAAAVTGGKRDEYTRLAEQTRDQKVDCSEALSTY